MKVFCLELLSRGKCAKRNAHNLPLNTTGYQQSCFIIIQYLKFALLPP